MSCHKKVSIRTGKVSWESVIRISGKQIKKTHKRKTDALEWERKLLGDELTANALINPTLNLSVNNAINRFIPDSDDISASDRDTRTRLLRLTDSISHIKLNRVKKSHLLTCRDSLNVSSSTKNRYLNDWGTFCHWVSYQSDLNYKPQEGIRKLPEPTGRTLYLTQEQQLTLLSEAEKVDYYSTWGKLRLLVLIALATGARKGELLALNWKDIQWTDGVAIIRGEDVGAHKTGYREVPLPSVVINELLPFRRFNGLIFCNKQDEDTPFEFKKQWNICRINAELPDCLFHSLRHTAASNMAKAGKSLLQIGTILGHKSAQTTLRYSHLVERKQLHEITAEAVRHLG